MAGIIKNDILHVASLAKLTLKENEIEKFHKQLSEVVKHISELSKVDTTGVNPASQTTGLINIFRNDQVSLENSLTENQALSGTDKTHNGYFKVKAILQGRTDK